MQPQTQSKFRKEDFETGFILQSKGDQELVYIARKKPTQAIQNRNQSVIVTTQENHTAINTAADTSTNRTNQSALNTAQIIVTIREITKKRLTPD